MNQQQNNNLMNQQQQSNNFMAQAQQQLPTSGQQLPGQQLSQASQLTSDASYWTLNSLLPW